MYRRIAYLLATTATCDALALTRRAAARVAAGGAVAAAAAPALAVTAEQRANIKFLYGEIVPETMSDLEFRQRYAAGTSFSQDRQHQGGNQTCCLQDASKRRAGVFLNILSKL